MSIEKMRAIARPFEPPKYHPTARRRPVRSPRKDYCLELVHCTHNDDKYMAYLNNF